MSADGDEGGRPLRAYLGGPGVFRPDAKAHGERLVALCRESGVIGLYPLDAELDLHGVPKHQQAAWIKGANKDLLVRSDVMIADMTPFRGPGMDGGTAWEMGYAEGLGIEVFAYSEDTRNYAERVERQTPGGPDMNGLTVEDFDLPDNLMMASGIVVHRSFEKALAAVVAAYPDGAPNGEDGSN